MEKVRIDLYGGLGNQMFGGALGLALVGQFPQLEVELSDRLVPMGSNPSRRLSIDDLGLFNGERIKIKTSSNVFIKAITKSALFRRVWWKIQRVLMRNSRVTQQDIWRETEIGNNSPVFSDYFNDWFFIELANKTLRTINQPHLDVSNDKIKRVLDLVTRKDVIAIHCRIGDYLKHPSVYEILEEDYFIQAIRLIEREQNSNCELVVFCESSNQFQEIYPSLAKRAKLVIDKNYEVSDSQVFSILCRSNNLIAANSTFSIWAAWFVQNQRGTSIVPIGDEKTSIADGSIYLDWTLFDLSTRQFTKGREFERNAWFMEKQRLFVRLGYLFQ